MLCIQNKYKKNKIFTELESKNYIFTSSVAICEKAATVLLKKKKKTKQRTLIFLYWPKLNSCVHAFHALCLICYGHLVFSSIAPRQRSTIFSSRLTAAVKGLICILRMPDPMRPRGDTN